MKLAVMQPYFLPYIGYWQLVNAVDRFVVFDDVNFINRGWINRNRILVNGQACLFTIPLSGASQNRRINEIELAADDKWRDRLLKTVSHAYARAPEFGAVVPLLEGLVRNTERQLSRFLLNSLTAIAEALGIATEFVPSSTIYQNSDLKGQERIIDICRREAAAFYVNLPGGKDLYHRPDFDSANVTLSFLRPTPPAYPQFGGDFIPNLSVVDALMFNSPGQIREMLLACELE